MEPVLPQLCSRITEQTPAASPSSPHHDLGNPHQQHRAFLWQRGGNLLPCSAPSGHHWTHVSMGTSPQIPSEAPQMPSDAPQKPLRCPSEAPQKPSDACAHRPSASPVQGRQDLGSCALPAGADRGPEHPPSTQPCAPQEPPTHHSWLCCVSAKAQQSGDHEPEPKL